MYDKRTLEKLDESVGPFPEDWKFFLDNFCEVCIRNESCDVPIALDVVISEDAPFWLPQLKFFSYGTEDERYRCADIERIVCEEYQSPQLSFKGFLPPSSDSHIRLLELLKEDIEE